MPSSQLRESIRTVFLEARKAGVIVSGSNECYNDDPVALFQRATALEEQALESDALQESMEQDVDDILQELGNRSSEKGDAAAINDSVDQHQHQHQPKLSSLPLEVEAKYLQIKLQVLEECSTARSLLDESIALLESSTSSSSSSTATPRMSNHDEACDGSIMQESSRLYSEACSTVTKAEDIFSCSHESSTGNDQDSPILSPVQALLHSLQSCLERHRNDIISTAQSLWKQQIVITATSVRSRSCTALSTVLQTLQEMEAGKECFAELIQSTIQDQLHHHVLQPILDSFQSDGKTTISNIEVSRYQVAKEQDERFLEWTMTKATETTDALAAWKSTLEFLHSLFAFLSEHVLLENKDLMAVAGTNLFATGHGQPSRSSLLDLDAMGLDSQLLREESKHSGALLGPLLQALERSCIPNQGAVNSTDELQAISDRLQPTIDAFVSAMNTVFGLDTAVLAGDLSSLPASIEAKYVACRRTFHLQEARRILVETDYHATVRVGDASSEENQLPLLALESTPVFPLPSMGISSTALQLHAYARSIMDEAAQLSTTSDNSKTVVVSLYHTARQTLDLFRALIPIVRSREVATIPQVAAILYNDGIYLANECMTIGLDYKDRLSSSNTSSKSQAATGSPSWEPRPEMCMMVDMSPRFLQMAELSLANMLRVQKEQIQTMVSERISLFGQSLRSNEPLAEWSDAEAAIDAAIYHIQHLLHAWQPVLAMPVLYQCLGRLADAMLSLFLDPILEATDISSEATQFVHRLLLQRALRNMASSLPLGPSNASQWNKCAAVGQFMDMTLVDVHAGLTKYKTLQSLRASEVTQLLEACFDDSMQRRKLIQLLARQPE